MNDKQLIATGFQSTEFDRRAGLFKSNLQEDINRRMDKRVADFQSPRNRLQILDMVSAIDKAAPEPLTNDELGEMIDRLVRSI